MEDEMSEKEMIDLEDGPYNWFADLYRLSSIGQLSINDLFKAFKKEIAGKYGQGRIEGKTRPLFYSHEWPWCSGLDGIYAPYSQYELLYDENKKLREENQKLKGQQNNQKSEG